MVIREKNKFSILLLMFVLVLISLGFASACVCKNSLVEDGEECDNGLSNGFLCWASYGTSCTYCTDDCQNKTITNYCGDGIKQDCEECDDGNTINNDLCSNLCKKNNPEPVCGDDICNGDETYSTCPEDCGMCSQNCIVTVTQPTTGWYNEDIPIEWSYSESCSVATQLIQRKDGNILKDIKYIGNNYSRTATWYSTDNWFEEGNFSLCIYSGMADMTNELGCSSKFGIDLTSPIITAPNRECYEGETITLTASATDALSGVDASSWKWDLDNDGIYEKSGQNVLYLCESAGEETGSVKVSDNAGNSANKVVAITINSLEPTCDHEIAIKYTYADTFNTGIGISQNNIWLDNPIVLTKGETHSIKYKIDNLKETDDNVHILVKLNNEIISEYDKLINEYHSKTLDLNISNLQCNNSYTLTLEIESDGLECNLTDNLASRQISIQCGEEPPVTCGDDICNGDETCSTCPEDCGICPECPDCPTCPTCCNTCCPISTNCGNGVLDDGEECDDGNLNNFDGCSRVCYAEEDYEEYDNNDNDCDEDDCDDKNVLFLKSCESNWKCTGWSECSNGVMTRQCHDENSCNNAYNQPIEQTNCDSPIISNVYVEDNTNKSFWILSGIVLLIILIIILVNLL
jgi:cysteine-rich repeat protein